jgi:hypothetical protein
MVSRSEGERKASLYSKQSPAQQNTRTDCCLPLQAASPPKGGTTNSPVSRRPCSPSLTTIQPLNRLMPILAFLGQLILSAKSSNLRYRDSDRRRIQDFAGIPGKQPAVTSRRLPEPFMPSYAVQCLIPSMPGFVHPSPASA